jgi:Extensin-like protein C-terminus
MGVLAATLVFASLGHGVPAESADVPLPRPRPPVAAAPSVAVASDHGPPTDCDKRLSGLAEFTAEPTLTGPGACGGADLVKVNSVLLPDGGHIAVEPPAMLRCSMAESLAAWVRDEIVPQLKPLGASLRAIENLDSYECRGRNGAAGGKVSEHGKGNAIDVRGFRLADGRKIVLTDVAEPKSLREDVRQSACSRFTTVLGPGSDGHHEQHIHLDVIERHNGYRICQWAVRESQPTVASVQPSLAESIAVGPWSIAAESKTAKFDSCTMSRSAGELGITFVRGQDGLSMLLTSPKWKLDQGQSYPVQLVAGSLSVKAQALAERKSVTVALEDSGLISNLRKADVLQVRGEGATLRVPLDDSAAALDRLETCFGKRETVETNPFVAPGKKEFLDRAKSQIEENHNSKKLSHVTARHPQKHMFRHSSIHRSGFFLLQ